MGIIKPFQAGIWTALVFLAAKLEAVAETHEPEARLEPETGTVRVRGVLKVKAANTIELGDTILTLPEGMRPAKTTTIAITSRVVGSYTTTTVNVLATGVVKTSTGTIPENSVIPFEFTFSLT